jgi:hypothetical protein
MPFYKTLMRKGHLMSVTAMCLLTIMIGILATSNQINKLALGQSSPTDATTTFSMNGLIGSLVFGMAPNTKIIDMTAVQKFILSGDWNMHVNHGKLADFKANFYTGPVNGGTSNHTHQLSNFRVSNDNGIIHLTPDKSTSISGIVDVGTNGKKVWDDVNATVVVSKGRTISINLADKDTQRHFMGQQIYGIVKKINI